MTRLLLVDDEGEALLSLSRALKSVDTSLIIEGAGNAEQALKLIEKNDPLVAVVDLSLNSKSGVEAGFELLHAITSLGNRCKVIVLTGHSSVENGVRALNSGASHFLEKPPEMEHLLALIRDCARQAELFRSYQENSRGLNSVVLSKELVGRSKEVASLKDEILFAASTNQSILLVGETGTGKTLCASLIHRLSPRSKNKFICYTPGFNNADLVNSDLYGHLKGSFTGAVESRQGLLKEADQGTFFLDEVDELPQDTQVTLLRVIQSKSYRSLGSNKEEQSDFRLITATNRAQNELLSKFKLRKDFYHRIAHKVIRIAPLRDRVADIRELSEDILRSMREREQLQVFSISVPAFEKLEKYNWPGNVRELQAVVEGAAYLARFRNRSEIQDEDLQMDSDVHTPRTAEHLGFHDSVENFKKKLVKEAMSKTGGNQVQAARLLGLDRSGLRRILGKE